MQEHENDGRQAQLREAAEALVGWMHARRAAWSDEEPLETAPPPVFRAPPPVLAAAPVFAPPAPPPADSVLLDPFDDEAMYDLEPVAVLEPVAAKAAEPSFRPQSKTAETPSPSLVESLVSAAARMAPGARAMKVAAVVAVLAVGGWLASGYVGNVKTWLTGLTDKANGGVPAVFVRTFSGFSHQC